MVRFLVLVAVALVAASSGAPAEEMPMVNAMLKDLEGGESVKGMEDAVLGETGDDSCKDVQDVTTCFHKKNLVHRCEHYHQERREGALPLHMWSLHEKGRAGLSGQACAVPQLQGELWQFVCARYLPTVVQRL